MEFYDKLDLKAISRRLKMLTDMITEDVSAIYQPYGVDFKAKWFPVFYLLSDGIPRTIIHIAKETGHSLASVNTTIREMSSIGFVEEGKDKEDGQRKMVELSAKGMVAAQNMQIQLDDVGAAIEFISQQTKNNLWEAIKEWEYLLTEKSLLERVDEQKKIRESQNVRIVPYKPAYQEVSKSLNEEWITSYFEMEEADRKILNNPQGYILDKGGYIFIGLYKDEPVGVCALLKINDSKYNYELAKMAVSPKAQGKNIGFLLGRAAITKAIEVGARMLYLESNIILKPAINLYKKLGFKKVAGHPSPYKRCNIQMELILNK